MCFNVLMAAARNGDAYLATEVVRVLTERDTVFNHQHYELLMESYLNAGDLKTAMSILTIMQEAGVKPVDASTGELFKYLTADEARLTEAIDVVLGHQDDHRKIPTVTMNCIINATCEAGDIEKAFQLYKALHMVCSDGPTVYTFNLLFRGCSKARRKDIAMFLASEMLALGVTPNALTYDRLVLTCVQEPDYEDAFNYYAEMKAHGFFPRPGTVTALVKRTVAAGDARAFDLLADIEAWKESPDNPMYLRLGKASIKEYVERNWKGDEAVLVDRMTETGV